MNESMEMNKRRFSVILLREWINQFQYWFPAPEDSYINHAIEWFAWTIFDLSYRRHSSNLMLFVQFNEWFFQVAGIFLWINLNQT